MNAEDPLQQNIRRTTGQHALKKIRAIVDEENEHDAAVTRTLRWLSRYGWIVLVVIIALLARLTGVY
jgi:cation transport ATPase